LFYQGKNQGVEIKGEIKGSASLIGRNQGVSQLDRDKIKGSASLIVIQFTFPVSAMCR